MTHIKAFYPRQRLVLLTEGQLDTLRAKTAVAMLRYRPGDVVCVLDSTRARQDLFSLVGVGRGIPIVASPADAMSFEPTGLLIGIAPAGGLIPGEWRSIILEFLAAGCEVVSGLHEFLGDDAAFSEAARLSRTRVVDLRRPPRASVGCGRALQHRGLRVLTVGTDECIGKMTAALEIAQGAAARGWDARFIATGQTGIAVSGYGVAIDAVVSDFLAGAVEQLILENQERQLLVIEGQGAITSPSFSGVTLGLLHGCLPQALVLCHDLTRTHSRGTSFPLPSVRLAIDLYEALARAIAPCRTVAICLNTSALHEDEAQSAIRQLGNEVNLPVSDPLRFGTDAILDELSRMQARRD